VTVAGGATLPTPDDDGIDHAHTSFEPVEAAARAEIAKAIRDLGHALVGHETPAEELTAVAAELRGLSERLSVGATRQRAVERPTGDWGPAPASGQEMFSFDERPISGTASPYGLDMRIVRDGDEVVAHVTLRSAHEGAPGRSHGGIVSALFDDVFGFILTIHQQPGFTGELTIRYERGVPLHQPLECRVRLDGRDGRKLFMTGELSGAGDHGERVVYTRGKATFIAIDREKFAVGGG
jgi:acyl-coenzyme A thioesterase PaaI-like protein